MRLTVRPGPFTLRGRTCRRERQRSAPAMTILSTPIPAGRRIRVAGGSVVEPARVGPRVALVAPAILEGDAVGHDVLGMADALERLGCVVRLFARVADAPRPVAALEDAAAFASRPDDVL